MSAENNVIYTNKTVLFKIKNGSENVEKWRAFFTDLENSNFSKLTKFLHTDQLIIKTFDLNTIALINVISQNGWAPDLSNLKLCDVAFQHDHNNLDFDKDIELEIINLNTSKKILK